VEWTNGRYRISDDPDRLDRAAIRRFLADAYWANDRPADVIDRSLERSITFGLFDGAANDAMVGMARVVSDQATFAWLCDVYIDEAHRGGTGTWLVETVMGHPRLQGLRWMLATSYSHSLYERFGFRLVEPGKYMIRPRPGAPPEA
jgi:hypothetical protein